jgi:hypothetical protein
MGEGRALKVVCVHSQNGMQEDALGAQSTSNKTCVRESPHVSHRHHATHCVCTAAASAGASPGFMTRTNMEAQGRRGTRAREESRSGALVAGAPAWMGT